MKKNSDELDAEVEIPLTVSQVCKAIGIRKRDPFFVRSYRLGSKQLHMIIGSLPIQIDNKKFDYFLETEVRTEFMEEYYASHPKPSAPPQTFPPVLGDVVHLRPIRGNKWWVGQASDDSQDKKIKSKDE